MSSTAARLFDNEEVRDKFLEHYEDLRGKVRTEVVRRHLREVSLSPGTRPLRVLDIGCGDGRDSLWLAGMGHEVVAIDPAGKMLDAARSRCAQVEVEGSIEFAEGDVAYALQTYGPEHFDLVLSHGVLMYQEDPAGFIECHLELVKKDGILSLLTKNAEALTFRAAREASIDEAIMLLDNSSSVGHLGIATGAHTIQYLADVGFTAGATVRSWAGVRMFSDSPSDPLLEASDEKVVELEWRAALRDPHRHLGALLHVLLMRGVDVSLLPVK